MFTVGGARLAQVSKRLLRYYDEIGLLKPNQTDNITGYRYYSADQLLSLNRILALKDLGLSLDQIQRILRDNISTDEIQGMLLFKKAEIERQLQDELKCIRNIESRLQSIRDAEANKPLNVVIKQMPLQPVMSVRTMIESFEAGMMLFREIRRRLPEKTAYGFCFCICHGDGLNEHDMEMEIGCFIEAGSHLPVPLSSGLQLQFCQLPSVPIMATTVVQGAVETFHRGYREIGLWAERNDYRLAGEPREIIIQLGQLLDGSDLITEIQFPLEFGHASRKD